MLDLILLVLSLLVQLSLPPCRPRSFKTVSERDFTFHYILVDYKPWLTIISRLHRTIGNAWSYGVSSVQVTYVLPCILRSHFRYIQIYSMIAQELVNGKEIFVNLGLAEDRFDPSSVPVQF